MTTKPRERACSLERDRFVKTHFVGLTPSRAKSGERWHCETAGCPDRGNLQRLKSDLLRLYFLIVESSVFVARLAQLRFAAHAHSTLRTGCFGNDGRQSPWLDQTDAFSEERRGRFSGPRPQFKTSQTTIVAPVSSPGDATAIRATLGLSHARRILHDSCHCSENVDGNPRSKFVSQNDLVLPVAWGLAGT